MDPIQTMVRRTSSYSRLRPYVSDCCWGGKGHSQMASTHGKLKERQTHVTWYRTMVGVGVQLLFASWNFINRTCLALMWTSWLLNQKSTIVSLSKHYSLGVNILPLWTIAGAVRTVGLNPQRIGSNVFTY